MIQIVGENNFFLVLDKPAGFSVHNEKPAVLEFLQAQKLPVHFVNRLDRETSGLMIIAREPLHHEPLSLALATGKKSYRALLRGAWKSPNLTQVWNKPLTDKAESRDNPQGKSAERLPCESLVQVVRSNSYLTEAVITIRTGRQHQIRKHTAIAKHPIVGDNRYNEKKYNQLMAKRYKAERMWLHAELLEFTFLEKNYSFESKLSLDSFF